MPIALQLLAASLFSLPFSLLDAWDAVASAKLAARLKAIKDAGDPTSLAELAKRYPDPPPGRNAAQHLNAAFAAMDVQDKAIERLAEGLPVVGQAQLPEITQDLPPAMLRAIRGYLAANAEALAALHKAAGLEECKFDLDFAKGVEMELRHLAKMRQAARLLALEALERTESGKGDDAAASLLAALRTGEAVRREPTTISTLVRIACDAIAIGQMERWASRARPSPAALERVEAALAAAADTRLVEGALLGERCFGVHIYQTDVLGPNRAAKLAQLGWGDGPLPLAINIVPNAYFKMDMCHYLDIMEAHLAAARKPYPQSHMAGAQAGLEVEGRVPRYYVVSRMILPALGRVVIEGQRHMARCETARVALATLRYKAKQGRLPAGLAALVPDFLKAVPPDPFDGKPLRYKGDEAGLVVYAVGEDGKDNGGAVQPLREGRPSDVGFRVRWPKAQF
ncbi:MAG: hypothetical protein FJ291_07730 [Planctomycetes bacterium]|nr:hypothetical protein [Planctomycetota bacterium]